MLHLGRTSWLNCDRETVLQQELHIFEASLSILCKPQGLHHSWHAQPGREDSCSGARISLQFIKPAQKAVCSERIGERSTMPSTWRLPHERICSGPRRDRSRITTAALGKQSKLKVTICASGPPRQAVVSCALAPQLFLSEACQAGNRHCLQETLKRAVATTSRGKTAGPQQQADILQAIRRLEAVSPTRRPAESSLLSGRWSLLYTGESFNCDRCKEVCSSYTKARAYV